MAFITADEISVHFPISDRSKFSGNSRPVNQTRSGSNTFISALNAISFSIVEGQRVGIIGRNGSGKSTLLRVLGKVYAPSSGRLVLDGKISSLFNLSLGTQADISGRDNIIIRGLVKGYKRREILEFIPEIIEFSGLKDFIDLPMRTYSDGMRMRLLFAIATSFSPEILLLDEWIGAGDSDFQKKAAHRMNALVDQAGITVIASHNRQLLRRVCDSGIWLEHGVLRAMGPIDSVYEKMDTYHRLAEEGVAEAL